MRVSDERRSNPQTRLVALPSSKRSSVHGWPGQARPTAFQGSERHVRPKYSGFLPGRHVIEGYGSYGFRFGGMSHRGSILALPVRHLCLGRDGAGGTCRRRARAGLRRAAGRHRTSADRHGRGTASARPGICARRCTRPASASSRWRQGAAARTYSILLGENRRVAAALIAVA